MNVNEQSHTSQLTVGSALLSKASNILESEYGGTQGEGGEGLVHDLDKIDG